MICKICKRDFSKRGGLLYSPPMNTDLENTDNDLVVKFHICTECWYGNKIQELIK